MVRRPGTSRVTRPGTSPDRPNPVRSNELPSIRQRRPFMFWGLMVAMAALIVPVFASLVQAFT